ncbi:hypothetical protein H3Z83_08445 [Tenacibaculum sp. S7007]|uniref:Uncharacterized protein n=1 Tax=Tenacibaculum pelagium TaxID=2759527 RepID=A0A839AQM9_9FLAO|nr:DUF6770 family protein [Tenacibaculum pelagium]MBA6156539.1 hypothetical protein [Tenacibaculum pelagium]
MKNKILLLLLFISVSINAQISSLSNLASGELEMFSAIYELDGSIYGYFTIYKLEEISEKEERYEYVLLDKNLNKAANGEFTDIKYKKFRSKYYYPEKIGDNLIISKMYFLDAGATVFMPSPEEFSFVSHRTLEIKTNKVSTPFYYKNNEIVIGSRAEKKIKKTVKKEKNIDFPLVYNDGFFMFERVKGSSSNLKKMKSLKAFGLDKKLKWEYLYNLNSEKINYNFELLDDQRIIFRTFNKTTKVDKIHSLDAKTGKPIFIYEIENKKSEYSHSYTIESTKDKIYIVGKMSPYKSYAGYDFDNALGFFRIELDNKGNEVSKKYFKWIDAVNHIKIKKNGKLDKGYKLASRQYFVFEDGSMSILAEKVKKIKTKDFVVLNFDKNFKLSTIKTLEKEKDRYSSDYLFSQKIEDGKGVVFYYKYFTNKKAKGKLLLMGIPLSVKMNARDWTLGIVTIINGEMNKEEIPMHSEEHSIIPYVAKEGYILLREYNKDSDYDQIRLEKLNY